MTVGRVGKLSSLRTLVNKKDGTEGGEGGGDTPLDKAQAAIAESIEGRRKQEKQEQERREENRRLESKIQQHVHGNRSHQVQPTMTSSVTSPLYSTAMYPHASPTDLSQGQPFYPYSGYQYPYSAQSWTGSQWTAPSSMVAGGDHVQYTQTSGTGERQYESPTVPVASVEAGTTKREGVVSTAAAATEHGSGTGEQKHEDANVTPSAPPQQPLKSHPPVPPPPQDSPTPPPKAETAKVSGTTVTATTSVPQDTVATTTPLSEQVPPDSRLTDAGGKQEQQSAMSATEESTVNQDTKTSIEEETRKKEDGDEITECEMEIDSGEGTPIATPAPEDSPDNATFSANASQMGGEVITNDVIVSGHAHQAQQRSGAEEALIAKSEDAQSGARDQELENSPEPLPPGVECEQKPEVTPSAVEPQSTKVVDILHVDDQTKMEVDGAAMEENRMEATQPGMESESSATSTQKQGIYMYIIPV